MCRDPRECFRLLVESQNLSLPTALKDTVSILQTRIVGMEFQSTLHTGTGVFKTPAGLDLKKPVSAAPQVKPAFLRVAEWPRGSFWVWLPARCSTPTSCFSLLCSDAHTCRSSPARDASHAFSAGQP